MKKKVLRILIIFIVLIILLQINSFALRPSDINGNTSVTNEGELTGFVGTILGVIDTCGTILAIAVLIIIGIKYMTASLEGKAKWKEQLMPYAIGCFILFTAPKLARMIYNIASKI